LIKGGEKSMGDQNFSFQEGLSERANNFEKVASKVEEEVVRLDNMLKEISNVTDEFLEKRPSLETEINDEDTQTQVDKVDFQHNRMRTLLEARNAIAHLSGAAREITERRQTEEAYQQALENLKQAEQRIGHLEETEGRLQSEVAELRQTEEAYQQVLENLKQAEQRIGRLQEVNAQLQRGIAKRQKADEALHQAIENLKEVEGRIATL
jgi:chromosome segregation ATPase